MKPNYAHGVVGGTFDRFHKGHEKLLMAAYKQSEKVIIGLTTEALYKHKYAAKYIESFALREERIKHFLEKNGLTNRSHIVPISDIYGITIHPDQLDALFVTEDTYANALKVNEKRTELNLPPLKIIRVPFALSDDGLPITSERIRMGEIDRHGFVYTSLFTSKELFTLPVSARDNLRKPFGELHLDIANIVSLANNRLLISVGDVVTHSFVQHNRMPEVSIIDFKTQRNEINQHDLLPALQALNAMHLTNHAGTINAQAAFCIEKALHASTKQPQLLIVAGEEDLLVIPAVLYAPLGALVVYGQAGKGAICVEVTEETKKIMVGVMQTLV